MHEQWTDRQRYEQLFRDHYQPLCLFAYSYLKDMEAAKDVVQDVFTTLWIKSAEKNIRPPLAAFLYTLIRNKILDRIKHSKVEAKYLASLKQVMSLSEALPDRMYIEKELYDQIEKEISQLPEKMRIIFEKSRKEYKSNQEIAEELSISNKTVRNQLSNAVRILRNKFGDSAHIFLTFF